MLRQYLGLELGTARSGIELGGRLGDVGHEKDGAGRTTFARMLGFETFHRRADFGAAGILGRPEEERSEFVFGVFPLLLFRGSIGRPCNFLASQAVRGNTIVGFGLGTSPLGGNVHHEQSGL